VRAVARGTEGVMTYGLSDLMGTHLGENVVGAEKQDPNKNKNLERV
jgi:2-iminoacetate synthase ThiH